MSVTINRRPTVSSNTQLHDNPLINRVLLARGVESQRELNFALADLPRWQGMPGIDAAVERLLQALKEQQHILIVGDYDCDGATSTTLALLVFRAMGFEHVRYLVPNRFDYGYGLTPAIVDVACENKPDLIFTVDNGIASVDGVAHARECNIDVIVTDHHLPPSVLPDAEALVNPNLVDSAFPSKNLAGVGVCFYVLLALRARLAKEQLPGGNVKLAEYLDLVAIGTVADVVPLDKINRTLVEQGLRRIRARATRPGVLALLALAGREVERASIFDIGFGIGPRLNAAGRLDDMSRGIQCLSSDNAVDSQNVAAELDGLNKQRRVIEKKMREQASDILQDDLVGDGNDDERFGIVLFNEDWHQGVIGIVAGRIKDELHKPAVVFSADGETHLKGSARSIPGVHIRDVLDAIATANPGMINKFGGHAMAAGMTIERTRFAGFADAFNDQIKQVVSGVLPSRQWLTDGSLNDSERSLHNAQLLADVCPWGQDFPQPIFDDHFVLESSRVVGNAHLKLRLRSVPDAHEPKAAGGVFDAIAFNQPDSFVTDEVVQVVYSVTVNLYRGRESLQLNVLHIQKSDG